MGSSTNRTMAMINNWISLWIIIVGGLIAWTNAQQQCSSLNSYPHAEMLQVNATVEADLEKGEPRRYFIELQRSSPLTLMLSPSCAQPPSTKLYYNETINATRYQHENGTAFTIACAPAGRYDLLVDAKQQCRTTFVVQLQHPYHNWTLLERRSPTKVRFQNRLQRKQMMIKWNKSKLDVHAINYCFTINTIEPQSSLCHAYEISKRSFTAPTSAQCPLYHSLDDLLNPKNEKKIPKVDPTTVTVICTGKKTRKIVRELTPNTKYYVDVFAVHSKLYNFSFLLKSTKTWFNRTHPIALSDGKLSMSRLSDLGGRSVFSFKVPANPQTPVVKIQVIPCGGAVNALIFRNTTTRKVVGEHREKLLVKEMSNIYKPTTIMIPVYNEERLTIRVSPSDDETVNFVKIAATVKNKFAFLPHLPNNTSIVEIKSTKSCQSTTIAWHGTQDARPVRYCVILIKLAHKNRSAFDYFKQNLCTPRLKLADYPDLEQIMCYPREKISEMESFKLGKLSPNSRYLVHINVHLIGSDSVSYEPLQFTTHKRCPTAKHRKSSSVTTSDNHTTIYNDEINFVYPHQKLPTN